MAFDLVDFHERAVRIPSHEDVGEMRDLLVETLADAGADPRVDDAGNVLATRGAGDPHYVLNTHLDTVPPHVPYERDGDTVRGRGACDAKGPLAALLDAFLAVEPDGRVTLAVTPDEERLSTGAAALDLEADGYVVGEPTGLDVCNAARGRFEGTVTVTGSAAHAAEPDSGVNAIRAAAPLLESLDSFDEAHGPGVHESLGAPTLQVTTVSGGEATNQVPSACRFTVDRRSVPPETAAGFRDSLESHLRDHAPADVAVEFSLTERDTPFLEAFYTDPAEPLVGALRDAARDEQSESRDERAATDGSREPGEVVGEAIGGEVVGGSTGSDVRPFAAATEASYFAADAPTVVFGPGVLADGEGAVAHAEREYVRLSEVEAAADAVRAALGTLLE